MTTRQEATHHALQWAHDAEARHRDAAEWEHHAYADAAQRMARMWADIARLLPAVLADQQPDEPEPCRHERPTLGNLIPQAHCTLPTGHRPPHRDPAGSSWNVAQRCPSHHAFDDYEEHCERQAGHHGIHTARGLQWGPNDPAATNGHLGSREAQANAAPSTSIPGQRLAADDKPPRCPSRNGGEQCERAVGHSGIHQGTSCGWRNATPATPDPEAEAARCCQLTVAHVAEQLERHARTAPGLAELERRCLEDAADFVRAHMPAAAMPEAWCAAKTPHGPHICAWPAGPIRCPGFPGSPS